MYFQILDNKKECYAIYCDSELYYYPNNLDLTKTWNWSSHTPANVDCAEAWASGATLKQACPEYLKDDLARIQNKGMAFLKAFSNAKVCLEDVCFYDLVPKKYLVDYCDIKNKISKHVFEYYKKPANYEFQIDLTKMINKISFREINISNETIKGLTIAERNKFQQAKRLRRIIYNQWGSKTGRLTTKPNSFPILTLPKSLRSMIVPNNDLFVELDYNSAEVRVVLALSGRQQPNTDIHEHIRSEVYNNRYSRDEVKQKVFAWLYNPKAQNKKLSLYVDKDNLLNKYYLDGIISSPLNRQIRVEEEKALNYLIQSTASDVLLRQAIKIDQLLKGTDSDIAFCIHDSLILDVSIKDKGLLKKIIDVFKKTDLGEFKVNVSVGKDFGSMRKIP
jgi:hypothetical protein